MDIFFKINLSTYDKSNILLNVKHSDSIQDVKMALAETLRMEPQCIRLSIMGIGKSLVDGHTVSDYGLHNGSIIDVRIRFHSGKPKIDKQPFKSMNISNNIDPITNTNNNNNNNNDNNNNDNNDNETSPTFHDHIAFFPTQSKERKIPNYYNYNKVILIIDFWCRIFGIKAIETELLDFIAIYTSYMYSKILCVAEDELKLCHFHVFVQLKGFNNYFKDQNKEIIRLWLDQYIELKFGQIENNKSNLTQYLLNSVNYGNNTKTFGLSNITTLKCNDIKQSSFDNNNNEMFILYASMPSTLIEIYRVKGELDNIVCWVEFGFMKKQNVKVFGLRSNIFKWCYRGMNIENNKDGLNQKLMINRQNLIDIEIVKVLKKDAIYSALSKGKLIETVQNRLKHRFWAKEVLIKQRISKLANDGYCYVEGELLLYLEGHDALKSVDDDDDF